MKNFKYLITLLFISSYIYCQTSSLDEIILQKWYQKDFSQNKIPGISLEKFYQIEKGKKTSAKKIIVAVLDSQIDLYHEDLKSSIWVNIKEMPNNGIDDDKNGYIDDIHGWDFLGTKKGGYMVYENYEYVRYVREFSNKFQDKKREEIQEKDIEDYDEYQRALKFYEAKNKYYKNWHKSLVFNVSMYKKVKDTLKHFFPKEDYTIRQLDSIYKTYKINDKKYRQRRDDNDQDIGALISYMINNFQVKQFAIEDIKGQEAQLDSVIEKNLNIDFNERKLIGDNPNQLEKGYGNNKIGASILGIQLINEHSTKVSSIIGANRKNNIGINGFSDNIAIMPLHISASGDEHDKDITMAIRYAVDNGAKVINMSIGKEFSLKQEWVSDALKYAEQHNVLVIHSAGNDGFNVDENPYYPSDVVYDGTGEVSNNFINVGSISQKLDGTFVSSFSNYGKKNVDLFAPGESIYTTVPENKYDFDSGTSLAAPMVSGTAALIWLYYPNLSVQEVKKIILDSGTAYDLEVIVPGTKDKKVKFSELSKSGKVVNVYNAMQMAEKVSKSKK
jgi:cell wall-associated protease